MSCTRIVERSVRIWQMCSADFQEYAVIIIPRYIMFRQLEWLNTYIPFYALALFACYPFFIFSMIQFIRGIPRDIDESAYMDGCSTWGIFVHMILPLSKPCLFSMGIFQFIWTWNDYFNPLIFINIR